MGSHDNSFFANPAALLIKSFSRLVEISLIATARHMTSSVTIARHVTELRNLHAIHLSDKRIAWYNRIIVITLKMPGKEYVL